MRKKSRNRARRISDAELLLADLTTNDVDLLTNIVREKLPDGVRIVDVLREYHHCRYPAEKVFCCVCGSRQHKEGLHVVRSDGKEATVGICCAKRSLGKEFVEANKRNRGERDRQGYLRIIGAFKPTALRIVQMQMARPWMECADGVRKARYDLRETLGRAFEVLSQAANKGAALTIPERVLVSKWTGSGDNWQNDDTPREERDRFAWIESDVGTVPGAALFVPGDPKRIVSDLELVLKNFRAIGVDTDSHSTSELRNLVKLLRAGREGLEALLRMKRAADDFFSQDSAAFVAGWIERNRNVHGHNFPHIIRARDGVFVNETMARQAAKPRFTEPAPELIEALAGL